LKTTYELFVGLSGRELPARQVSELLPFSQQESFFFLAAVKNVRMARLRECFSQTGIKKVFLGANLAGFGCSIPGVDVAVLDKGYFADDNPQIREQKIEELRHAVVIVNNNDVGQAATMPLYADFFTRCEQTVFVAWDWDNHHWLELSTFLATHADVYAPAHHENLYLLGRYNSLTAGPVYCATVQWSREFLTERIGEIIRDGRSAAPLGMHIPYGPFTFRSRVISTLNQHYSSIGFSDRNFHGRTAEDRFKEWCAHKSHWIVPVLNDVPIRIFDALATGGIPIVPESLRLLPPINTIDRRDIVFFGPDDIITPNRIVAEANAKFDAGGRNGIVARHRLALEQHHGDTRVAQMIATVAEVLRLRNPLD
jgi:hypothetical protein